MAAGIPSVGGVIQRFASRLRFPQLFFLVAGLFVFDLFFPDLIPAIDEILLGLLTLLLGSLRNKDEAPEGDDDRPPMKNVTPPKQ